MAHGGEVAAFEPRWRRGGTHRRFAETMLEVCGPGWERASDDELYAVYRDLRGADMSEDRRAFVDRYSGAARRSVLCRMIVDAAKNEPGSGVFAPPDRPAGSDEVYRADVGALTRHHTRPIVPREIRKRPRAINAAARTLVAPKEDIRDVISVERPWTFGLRTTESPEGAASALATANHLVELAGMEGRVDPERMTVGERLALIAALRALPLAE